MDIHSVDSTSYEQVRLNFESHQSHLIAKQKELNALYRSCSAVPNAELKTADVDALRSRVANLQEALANFKRDFETVRSLSRTEQTAIKIAEALRKGDLFVVLDNARENLRQAQELLALVQSQYQLYKAQPAGEQKPSPDNLFDKIWGGQAKPTPEMFVQQGRDLALTDSQMAQRCLEKAAQLHLEANQLEKALSVRKMMAEMFPIPPSHPLHDLESAMTERIKPPQTLSEHGITVSGLDSGTLKRGQINFRMRKLDGRPTLQATFQLCQPSKIQLDKFAAMLSQNLPLFERSLPADIQGKVSIAVVPDGYQGCSSPGEYSTNLKHGITLGKALEIRIEGVGVIRVGAEPSNECLSRRVTIELAGGQTPGKAIKQLQCLAGILGLGPALELEPKEEEERKKAAFLFRTFYPKEAYQTEHSREFYELSAQQMIKMITAKVPAMADIFRRYLSEPSTMVKVEITPGESVWSLPELSGEVRRAGGVGLMAGFEGSAVTLAKVIMQGSLCSEKRFEAGMVTTGGTSSSQDLMSGGAGSVFTRMITRNMIDSRVLNPFPDEIDGKDVQASLVKRFPHAGTVQLLYDLDALNRGGYAYAKDRYGSKSSAYYGQRPNLFEFTRQLDNACIQNEVMLLHGIPPGFLKKILVSSPFKKEALIQEFEGYPDICVKRDDKHYLIGYNGPALEDLIIVGKYFQSKMWE